MRHVLEHRLGEAAQRAVGRGHVGVGVGGDTAGTQAVVGHQPTRQSARLRRDTGSRRNGRAVVDRGELDVALQFDHLFGLLVRHFGFAAGLVHHFLRAGHAEGLFADLRAVANALGGCHSSHGGLVALLHLVVDSSGQAVGLPLGEGAGSLALTNGRHEWRLFGCNVVDSVGEVFAVADSRESSESVGDLCHGFYSDAAMKAANELTSRLDCICLNATSLRVDGCVALPGFVAFGGAAATLF